MARFNTEKAIAVFVTVVFCGGLNGSAVAQTILNQNYHVSFDRPEAWAMKYFVSSSLLSGLQPADPAEGRGPGSIQVGFETSWLPTLDEGQIRVGFNGRAPQDLNKAPVFVRPVFRVGLPNKFTIVVAAPPPFHVFGVTPHLFAFGLERPILERGQWILSWRGDGQVGSVKGAFTCPGSVLAFAPGTPGNPGSCIAESKDVASLRYAGTEIQVAYRIRRMPKLVPHATAGGNFVDGAYQLNAPLTKAVDQTRLWTRGGTFSTTFGVSYLLTQKSAFTVDAFYSPLWVKRTAASPTTNDGLFNVRALLSYTFR